MTRIRLLVVVAVVALLGVVTAAPARADADGSVLYAAGTNDGLAYARVVRLASGTLLATFEHTRLDGGAASAVVRRSTDDGATWSTLSSVTDALTGTGHPGSAFYQPFLYEFGRQLGSWPAGTLVLVANVIPTDGSATDFELWHSTDHGAHWAYGGLVQQGGASPHGIWEPFLTVDGDGNLICYFSDERQSGTHSQFIGHVVSTDGGTSWNATVVPDVASAAQADRPGMPTTVTLPSGRRVMSFEVCGGSHECEVRTKVSTDGGHTWGSGPADLGARATTTDGRYLVSSPVLAWSPASPASPAGGGDGTLLLSGMRAKLTATGGYAPEDHQIVLTGPAGGSWSWQPAPFAVSYAAPTSNCYPNYSPDLLPSTDGRSVRLTAPSRSGPNGCEERTGSAPAGVLPYASPFTGGTDAGWKDYGGCWSLSGGAYLEDCGGTGGSKALAGSTGWTDYTVATDVELTSADANANAGLLARVTDPDTGTDAQDGYYIGLSTSDIVVGRQAHGWTPLSLTAVPGGVAVGDWWHLSATLTGCTIAVTAYPVADPSATTTVTDTDCTFAAGLVGVRDFDATAAFRSFGVQAGGQ